MKVPSMSDTQLVSPPTAPGYAVRTAHLHADRAVVLELWRGQVASVPEQKYEWFYLGHPIEAPTLLLLTHGPQAERVGVAGLGTRRICVQGEVRSAGILVDLVVRPEHRTLYPALLLQRHMLRTALSLHRLVYGIPNKLSTPIVRRLGYTEVGDLVRYSKVLHHGTYLKRRLPPVVSAVLGAAADRLLPWYFRPHRALLNARESRWVLATDARFDALWQRVRGFDGLMGVRDAQFLSWRFLSQPGHHYRIFVLTPKGEAGISAYAVCEADGRALRIRDFLVDPSRDDDLRVLMHHLSRQAWREGFASLSLEFLGPRRPRALLAAAGMVERGKRVLYASFAPQDEARVRTLDWYVTSADEDQ